MGEKERTLLIGFDSPADRRGMEEWLRGLGYQVVESLDEAEAIDLVLLDSRTAPRLMERVRELRREAKCFLPVLVCLDAGEPVGRWLDAGCDDVLRREASKDEWRARIAAMLRILSRFEELGRRSEARLVHALENMSDGFVALDENWRYVYVNKKGGELLGRKPEDLIGKHIWTEFPEGIGKPFYENYYKAVETKREIFFEDYYEPWDRWFENRVFPSKEGLSIFFQDITERKRAEQELKRSETLFRAITEQSGEGISLADTKGNYVKVNPAFCRMTGYSQEELLTMNVRDLVPPDVDVKLFPRVRNGQSGTREAVLLRKDGSRFIAEIRGYPLRVGKERLVLGIVRDVTERKRGEDALRESEERFRKAFTTNPDAININRLEDGMFVSINEGFTNITGYTESDVIGKTSLEINIWANPGDRERLVEGLRKHGRVKNFEAQFRMKDGTIVYGLMSAALITLHGTPHVISITRDVTERKNAEEMLRKSRERLRHLFTVNPAVVYELDAGNFSPKWVSPNVTEVTGYSLEEARQPGWWARHVHPEDRERTKRTLERLRRDGRVAHEYRFQRKDGSYIWVRDELRLLRDDEGNPTEIVGSWMNITDRKEAEIELAKSEQRYRSVFENTGTAMIIIDENGSIAFANRQCVVTTGYSPEELHGTDWRGYVFADDLPMMESYFRLRFSHPEKAPSCYETRLIHADGSVRDCVVTVGTIGAARQVVVSMLDVTERKRAEEALRRSEQRLKAAERLAKVGHWELDLKKNVLLWSDEIYRIFDIDPSEFDGTYEAFLEMVHPDDRELVDRIYNEAVRNRSEYKIEHRIVLRDGTVKYVQEQCETFYDSHGDAVRSLGTVQDITDRVRAEETRRMLESAIDHAQECIMVSDRENRLLYVNRAFEKLTGYSSAEAIGNSPGLLQSGQHDRAFYQNLKRTIYAGKPWQGDMVLKKKSGEFYDAHVTVTPILDKTGVPEYFVSVHRDVTRERELERRVRQNQRLEAIGTLAGGIAHDFNNLLTPIIGYTELAIARLPSGSKVGKDLVKVAQAANRAADLVRQILSFSRRSTHHRRPLRMAPVVKETLKLLRASIPVTIEIRQEITDTPELVIGDPTEIHQVVMNLCTNAFHAMPDGGVLTVSLKAVDLDTEACAGTPGCTPGRYLNLSVEDTGHGIPPEIRDKIFEPYFTTKEEGRGTGLGLAVTHGIVSACGGAITVDSTPGKGTRFSLYFPVVEGARTKRKEKPAGTAGGRERILFVDDDPEIAELCHRALEQHGYSVTTSTDPLRALELFRNAATPFDMVITDMTMPGMTGDLLAEAILDMRPDLPIIVCTGFSERINKEKARKMGIRKLLFKPIAPGALLAAIRDVFDRGE